MSTPFEIGRSLLLWTFTCPVGAVFNRASGFVETREVSPTGAWVSVSVLFEIRRSRTIGAWASAVGRDRQIPTVSNAALELQMLFLLSSVSVLFEIRRSRTTDAYR